MEKYAIKGRVVHSAIESKIKEIEKQSKGLANNLYNYENQITTLTDEREQCYAQLAIKYLPDIKANSVQSTLKEVQTEVESIFKEKQRKRKELEEIMESLNKDKETLETELSKVTGQLNEKATKRDELEHYVLNELKENSRYVEIEKQAQQASMRLALYKNRVKEVESQANEKLPVYKKEKLFMYLLNRRLGTLEYKGKGIIKRLDSWVAGIIKYEDAKKNYDFLTSMPELMKIEVEKRQEELDTILTEMKQIEKGCADRNGLTKIIEEGRRLEEYRGKILSDIKKNDAEYSNYSNQRKELDNEKGEYHKKAIQKLKEYLKSETIAELKSMVRTTAMPEDDQLVDRIEEIDRCIRQLKDDSKIRRKERDNLQTKLSGLREILGTYESNEYESSRSYFQSGFDINKLLVGYLIEEFTSREVNDLIEENQHFKPRENYGSNRYSYSRTKDSDYDNDIIGSIFSTILSPSSHTSHSSGGGGWDFGGGGSHSIGGFGGGGGSHSIGGF